MREKPIELLREGIRVDTEKKEAWIIGGKIGEKPSVFENMADHLIANGVTIPFRCKDCGAYNTKGCCKGFGWCEASDRGMMDNDFCSLGGGETNG